MKKLNYIIFCLVLILCVSCGLWNDEEGPASVSLDISKLTTGGPGVTVEIGPNTKLAFENFDLSNGLIIGPVDDEKSIKGNGNGNGNNKYHMTYNNEIMPIPNSETEGFSATGKEVGINGIASFKISAKGVQSDFQISGEEYDGAVGYQEEFYYVNFNDSESKFYSHNGNFDKSRVAILSNGGGTGYSIVTHGGFEASLAGGLYDFSSYNSFLIDYARYVNGYSYSEKIIVTNPFLLCLDFNTTKNITINPSDFDCGEIPDVCVFQLEKTVGISDYTVTLTGYTTNEYDFRGRYYDGGNIERIIVPEFTGNNSMVLHIKDITDSILFELHPNNLNSTIQVTLAEDTQSPEFINLETAQTFKATADGSNTYVFPFYVVNASSIEFTNPSNIENGFVIYRRQKSYEQDNRNIFEEIIPIRVNSSGIIILNTNSETKKDQELLKTSKYNPNTLPYDAVMYDSTSGKYVKAIYNEGSYTMDTSVPSVTSEFIVKNLAAILPDQYWTSDTYSYTDSNSIEQSHGRLYLFPSMGRLEVKSEQEALTELAFASTNCFWPESNSNILAASNSANSKPETQVTMTLKIKDTQRKTVYVDLYVGKNPDISKPTESNVQLSHVHMHSFIVDENSGTATCQDSECATKRNVSTIVVPGGITGNITVKVETKNNTALPGGSTVVLFCDSFYGEIGYGENIIPGGNEQACTVYAAAPVGYTFHKVKSNGSSNNAQFTLTLKSTN